MSPVHHPVENRFGYDRVREQRVPVLSRSVGGDDQAFGRSFTDELVEVVGLSDGEVAHGKVIQDEQRRSGPALQTVLPRTVGVPTGEVSQQTRRLGEGDAVAGPARLVAERLG